MCEVEVAEFVSDPSSGNFGVIVLKRPDVEALRAQGADGADGGRRARQCGDAGDVVNHRHAPDGPVVEERLAAEGRVDHQINLTVQNLVRNVRTSFVDFIHDLDR